MSTTTTPLDVQRRMYPARYDRFSKAVRKYNPLSAGETRRALQENIRDLISCECGLELHAAFENSRLVFLMLAALVGFALLYYCRQVKWPDDVPIMKIGISVFFLLTAIGFGYCAIYLESGNFATFYIQDNKASSSSFSEQQQQQPEQQQPAASSPSLFQRIKAAIVGADVAEYELDGSLREFIFSQDAYPGARDTHTRVITQRRRVEKKQQQQHHKDADAEEAAPAAPEQIADGETDDEEQYEEIEVAEAYVDAPHDVLVPVRSKHEMEFLDGSNSSKDKKQSPLAATATSSAKKNKKNGDTAAAAATGESDGLEAVLSLPNLGLRLFGDQSLGDPSFTLRAELVRFRGSMLRPVVLRACTVEMCVEEFFSAKGFFYPPALRVELRRALKQLLFTKPKGE